MLHLKNEITNDLVLFDPPTSASQELEHWEKLVFAFDMDREQSSGSRNTQGSRTPSGSNTTGQQHLDLGEVSECHNPYFFVVRVESLII